MNNNYQPGLTIAIPTFNRPEKIRRQVLSILPYLSADVKLVVLDNYSDVEVSTLFDKSIIGKVTFIRNSFNIGADANIAKCFDTCQTKWLWTLSDDDIITEDALRIILHDIRLFRDCLFINYNKSQSQQIVGIHNFVLKKVSSYSDLFWMSICLYNVELLSPYMHHYFRALSTMQPGVYLITRALLENANNKIILSQQKIIEDGGKGIGWSRYSFFYSSLFLYDLLKDYRKILNNTLFRYIYNMCCTDILQIFDRERKLVNAIDLHILLMRRRGLYRSVFVELRQNLSFYAHLFYFKIFDKRINTNI